LARCRQTWSGSSRSLRAGPHWVTGAGYINIWKQVYAAEEALIEADSRESVVGAALYDERRIVGSKIENSEALLAMLRAAAVALSPAARTYLAQQPAASTTTPTANDKEPDDPKLREATAGAALRVVRRTVNAFRHDCWDGMVRARNRALQASTFLGIGAFAALALAIPYLGPQPDTPTSLSDPILAAAAFYVVGAVFGLFKQLQSESQTLHAIEDYGLGSARLLLTPVLSGLAAVGGVFVTAMAIGPVDLEALKPTEPTPTATPAVVATAITPASLAFAIGQPAPSPTPVPSSTPPSDQHQETVPELGKIFNLDTFRFGLVLAAIFGWTPGLLVDRVTKVTEGYKEALKDSEAS
jgi:hypothetical protein